jgi:hypothetical protein
MGFANNVIPWDLWQKGMDDFAFTVAANPSSRFPAKRIRTYNFLRVLWRLDLVSLPTIRKCASALQEGPGEGE